MKTRNIFLLFVFLISSLFGKSQINPGFETTPVSTNGWTLEVAFGNPTWSTNNIRRSGSIGLQAATTTSNARNAAHTTYTVTTPTSGTNYVHALGYFRRSTTLSGSPSVTMQVSTSGGTVSSGSATAATQTFQRGTVSVLASNNTTYHPRFSISGSSNATYYFDDVIIYTSTSSGVDITKPNAPTSLNVTRSSGNNLLTWSDGSDNATNTSGISGTIILRTSGDKTSSLSALNTSILDQVYYSTSSGVGPTTISDGTNTWTVLSNGTSSGTYTDVSAPENVTYVVMMRDRAYNYSSGVSFFLCGNLSNTYYSRSGQSNPNLLTNWTTNANGTGTNPCGFSDTLTFIVQTGHSYTTTSSWSVLGSVTVNGTLTIANSSDFKNLTISSGGTFTANNLTTTKVSNDLTITGTFNCQSGSTFEFNKTGGSQTIPTANYHHLNLTNGGTKTISNNVGIGGDFTSDNSVTVSVGDIIKFNGNNTQSLLGLTYKNIQISGTGGFTKTFLGNSNLLGSMTFVSGTGTIDIDGSSNDLLFTVRSTVDSTARIGNVGSWTISGNAVVERYVPAQRKWRLISIPVTGETLRQSLTRQVDGSYPNPICFAPDSQSGSGTLVTGHSFSSCTNATSVGFDHLVSGGWSSIRYYNSSASNPWASISSTPSILNSPSESGYLVFIRGDRQTLGSGNSVTTLRPKGNLKQGNQNIPINNRFFVVGNPYASPINFESIYENGVLGGNNTKIRRTFWTWDANVAGTSGVGGYRTLSADSETSTTPTYTATPSLPLGTTINDYLMINSSQAIMVERKDNTITGNLVIKESHKIDNKGNILNLRTINKPVGKIKIDLYRSSNGVLQNQMDGVVARFAYWYDNEPTDLYDIYKNNQFEENLSLYRKDITGKGRYMSIESRDELTIDDTLFVPFYNISQRNYSLKFSSENFTNDRLNAYLQDKFTKTETEITLNGGDIVYPFDVTSDSLSKSLDRFKIVFRNNRTTDLEDILDNKNITIFPNPNITGKEIKVLFYNYIFGEYEVYVYDMLGSLIIKSVLKNYGNIQSQKIDQSDRLKSGTYIVEIKSTKEVVFRNKIIIQ